MIIKAEGLNELSSEYAKLVDKEVFRFLRSRGYEFDETRQGIKKLQEQLRRKGKSVQVEQINQKMQANNNGILYQFDLEIKFKEVKI